MSVLKIINSYYSHNLLGYTDTLIHLVNLFNRVSELYAINICVISCLVGCWLITYIIPLPLPSSMVSRQPK